MSAPDREQSSHGLLGFDTEELAAIGQQVRVERSMHLPLGFMAVPYLGLIQNDKWRGHAGGMQLVGSPFRIARGLADLDQTRHRWIDQGVHPARTGAADLRTLSQHHPVRRQSF